MFDAQPTGKVISRLHADAVLIYNNNDCNDNTDDDDVYFDMIDVYRNIKNAFSLEGWYFSGYPARWLAIQGQCQG